MIRLLQKDELPLYKTIRPERLKTHSDNFSTVYEEESNGDSLKLSHAFSAPATRDSVYGSFAGNKLIGMRGFVLETRVKTRHDKEITQMFVAPACAGKGIGAKLPGARIDCASEIPNRS